jgi:hypothetical protein
LELFPGVSESATELRLVILWDVSKTGTLETLWLVCPKDFNRKTGEITVYWDAELPNPILGVAAPTEAAPASDLPYQQKKQKKTKEG